MDAMVTARMPVGKKEAGAEVLRGLGLSASQLINEVWDYLIARRQSPLSAIPAGSARDREALLAEAQAWADGLSVPEAAERFSSASDDEIRRSYHAFRSGIGEGAR